MVKVGPSTGRRAMMLALSLAIVAVLAPDVAALCPRNKPDCKDPKEPPDKPPPRAHGPVYPTYIVVTVLYAPPGNGSEVEYGAGSSIGSRTEITHSFKGGPQVATQGNVEVQAGFAAGGKTGTSFEVKKESKKTLSLQSQIDAIDHSKDTFYIWTNPQVNVTQTDNNAWSMALAVRDGQTMSIVPVTVAELKNPSSLPQYKKTALAALVPSDYQQILSLDPLVSGGLPDAKRFQKIDSLQLDGPDATGDPIVGQGLEESNETVKGSIGGFVSSLNVSIMVGTKFSLFGLLEAGLKVGATFEWDYENSTEKTSGTSETASVKLVTPTVGYNDVIDVYYDAMFKSFAFVSQTQSQPLGSSAAALTGMVMKSGKPAANQIVSIALPGGGKRRVITNSRGVYRVFNLPSGEHRVTALGKTQAIGVRRGGTATLQIRAQ